MRTFEIGYTLRGEFIEESFNAFTSSVAIKKLLAKLSRRDKLFFKIVRVSMV